ncbi:MAG TPA: GNAT family N-acetyltransferase [Fimbriimonadaceae bacterium]|nr:GNAT family N-acetyltransferase [Fimbriimonadaceae bacterium]
MVEVRPIEPSEAEDFLTILCRVFGLDFGRAKSVFFSEPLFDLRRKWALFENRNMLSVMTTVPLDFGWGPAIGIAGVATVPSARRKGLASELLREVLRCARTSGETASYLFARNESLYRKVGFEALDSVVSGPIRSQGNLPDVKPFEEVQANYERWSQDHPNRLRRDETRWAYWNWTVRPCYRMGSAYFALEGHRVREALLSSPQESWPVPAGTEWQGLETMTDALGVPLLNRNTDLLLMGCGSPGIPQMFMTDQF